MAKLPDVIYIIDPYDEGGNLLDNTEDVLWCQDAVGDENVKYVSAQSVTEALAELENRLSLAKWDQNSGNGYPDGLNRAITELKATIAKLGIEVKQ